MYKELNNMVLLCYESSEYFCHRHIVAAWFKILLGIEVPEKKAKGYLVTDSTRPEYIERLLEEAMRKNRNMRGFKSLRALYLFEKSSELERKADELEAETGNCYDGYRQQACDLRCEADAVEEEYLAQALVKRRIKRKVQ